MDSYENLLSDVITFLKETLSSEVLSPNANRQRLALLLRLASRNECIGDVSAALPYMDMNGNGNRKSSNAELAECYEELESNSEWSGCSSNFSRNYTNTSLYCHNNNPSQNNRFSSSSHSNSSHTRKDEPPYENTYIGIDSHSDSSKPNSQRESIITNSDQSLSPASSKSGELGERAVSTLSLSTLRISAIKYGQLSRKEKILFVEHLKRCWVALLGTSFYVYNSEKDSKASNVINVDEYRARPINNTNNSKKDFGFEIVCPGMKTYQFFANSKPEMESWISHINQSMPLPQTSVASSSTINNHHYQQWNHNNSDNINVATNMPMAVTKVPNSSNSNVTYHPNGNIREEDSGRLNSLKRESAIERELPSIPASETEGSYEHYSRPNPIIRPVLQNLQMGKSATNRCIHDPETFYHSIEESEAEALARYDYPVKKSESYYTNTDARGLIVNDNMYYNIVPVSNGCIQSSQISHDKTDSPVTEVIYDGVEEEEKENCGSDHIGMGRIQQIIQQIEEISQKNSMLNKKISPVSKRNSKILINAPMTVVNDEIYELVNTPALVNGKV